MHFATPLLPIQAGLWAKAEFCNPTGSVKDRAAVYLLDDAEKRGKLAPGGTVIESTSGNMGIALAALCKARGYGCILTMPASMSRERQQLLASYGATVVLTPGHLGMAGASAAAAELLQQIPGSFQPMQFENPANALAHYCTTGPEIWQQTGGKVAVFVAGVGTGGTLTGTARFLKEQNTNIRIVAVEPAGSPLLSQGWSGNHDIQGIGANFVPQVLDRQFIDQVIAVSEEAAFATAKQLGAMGIPAGISAGANVYAAQLATGGACTVTILPDHKDRYTSLGL